jgi:hypothetical protein
MTGHVTGEKNPSPDHALLSNVSYQLLLLVVHAVHRYPRANTDRVTSIGWTARKGLRRGCDDARTSWPRRVGYVQVTANAALVCRPRRCAMHTSPRACLAAMPPCPREDLGHWLCVPPFRMSCPFQAVSPGGVPASLRAGEQDERDWSLASAVPIRAYAGKTDACRN